MCTSLLLSQTLLSNTAGGETTGAPYIDTSTKEVCNTQKAGILINFNVTFSTD